MPFFRANLIGLKADRDKKEIGSHMYPVHIYMHACSSYIYQLHYYEPTYT
jgi:hypothetical protein